MGLNIAPTAGRVRWLESNYGFLALKTAVDRGWDAFALVDGWIEEFADATDVADLGGATAAAGYLHNAGGEVLTDIGAATVYTNYSAAANLSNGVTSADHANGGYTPAPAGGGYWAVKYGAAKTFAKFRIFAPSNADPSLNNGAAVQYTVWASDDSTNGVDGAWAQIGQSGSVTIAAGAYLDVALAPTGAVTWIKLTVATAYGSSLYFAEFQVYATQPAANVAAASAAIAADAAASQIRAVIRHQAVDAVTVNTDCLFDVSADNGATWAPVPLALDGAFDASSNLYSALVAVTPGAAIKWRWRTANAKEQRLHGLWLQWR